MIAYSVSRMLSPALSRPITEDSSFMKSERCMSCEQVSRNTFGVLSANSRAAVLFPTPAWPMIHITDESSFIFVKYPVRLIRADVSPSRYPAVAGQT